MRTSPSGSIAFAFEFRASFSGRAVKGAVEIEAEVETEVEVEAEVELKIEVVGEVEVELEVETARMPVASPQGSISFPDKSIVWLRLKKRL